MSEVKRYDGYQAYQVVEDSTHSTNETLQRPLFVLASDYDAKVRELAEMKAEVNALQHALAFWLPCVPAKAPENVQDRIAHDAWLLAGMEGDEDSAEALGWIDLANESRLAAAVELLRLADNVEGNISAEDWFKQRDAFLAGEANE